MAYVIERKGYGFLYQIDFSNQHTTLLDRALEGDGKVFCLHREGI